MNKLANWINGLIGAIINSAATTVTVMIVDPATFNIGDGLAAVGQAAGVSAILGAALFLKARPTPFIEKPKS